MACLYGVPTDSQRYSLGLDNNFEFFPCTERLSHGLVLGRDHEPCHSHRYSH